MTEIAILTVAQIAPMAAPSSSQTQHASCTASSGLRRVFTEKEASLLLMVGVEALPDLMYKSYRNCGSVAYFKWCRVYIINSIWTSKGYMDDQLTYSVQLVGPEPP